MCFHEKSEVEKVTWQMRNELLQKQSSNFNMQINALKKMIQKQQLNRKALKCDFFDKYF